MSDPPPEVVVVDDELSVRRGVELLLADGGLRVVGVASELGPARGLLRRRRYDVALLPDRLGGESVRGLLLEQLHERPGAPLVVWVGRELTGGALHDLISADAPGLVARSSPPQRLLQALRVVASGRRFSDPELTARLAGRPAAGLTPSRSAALHLLSPREREILRQLAAGASGAEIAAHLFLSAETVRTHVRNAARKLEARTRTQAVSLLVAHEARLADAESDR